MQYANKKRRNDDDELSAGWRDVYAALEVQINQHTATQGKGRGVDI
jgi:hypothetical protein